MPRKMRKPKPLIYVFCEGESEQCYAQFLKEEFEEVAEIKYPKKTGLFEEARDKFKKEARYISAASETDEIWFFFDVEESDHIHWESRAKIIEQLRKLRKKPNIRVRLLMTTGCIEYWLMLHYQMMSPAINCTADKERILNQLKQKMPGYQKGDFETTKRIARMYQTAVRNGAKTLANLRPDGIPTLEDTDARNHWLHKSSKTFTTVQEAIQYLVSL